MRFQIGVSAFGALEVELLRVEANVSAERERKGRGLGRFLPDRFAWYHWRLLDSANARWRWLADRLRLLAGRS